MLGKIECKRRRGVAGDEMVRQHHRPNGYESEHTLGDSEGQRGLVCCSPWGRRVRRNSDRTTILFHLSVSLSLCQSHTVLITVAQSYFNIRTYKSSNVVFLFQDWAILGCLQYSEFWDQLANFCTKLAGILTRIILNL